MNSSLKDLFLLCLCLSLSYSSRTLHEKLDNRSTFPSSNTLGEHVPFPWGSEEQQSKASQQRKGGREDLTNLSSIHLPPPPQACPGTGKVKFQMNVVKSFLHWPHKGRLRVFCCPTQESYTMPCRSQLSSSSSAAPLSNPQNTTISHTHHSVLPQCSWHGPS